ncbi:MAG: type II toxin-antitoxin system HicA family toxin [bacterium]|nr:type II toxin-antitoxin system HicA family toxin [bacterium]
MPKLYSARIIIKTLQKAGFGKISQKGSHIKLRGLRGGKLCTVIVPNHKEIAKGTFSSILKQAEMTRIEFEGV